MSLATRATFHDVSGGELGKVQQQQRRQPREDRRGAERLPLVAQEGRLPQLHPQQGQRHHRRRLDALARGQM